MVQRISGFRAQIEDKEIFFKDALMKNMDWFLQDPVQMSSNYHFYLYGQYKFLCISYYL